MSRAVPARPRPVRRVSLSSMVRSVCRHALMVVGVSMLSASTARAECIMVSATHLRETTTAIFTGTVVDVTRTDDPVFRWVTFAVDRYWKGDVARQVTVGQVLDAESPHLEPGNAYFISIYRRRVQSSNAGTVSDELISSCASLPLQEAMRLGIVKALGRSRAPR